VVITSSATGQGLSELTATLGRMVPPARPGEPLPEGERELAEHRVFRPAAGRGFEVDRVAEGRFRVTGEPVERLVARHDLDNQEALAYLEGRLRAMGVIDRLEAAGFRPGDEVQIAGVPFELDPDMPA
jgi:GTP-binding protein